MPADWQGLAELVRLRREERRLSQRELGLLAGTTDRLISSLERVERTTFSPAMLRAISTALGWTPDSAQHVLDGGEPVEASAETAAGASNDQRVEQLERDFDRLESTIADLQEQLREIREQQTEPNGEPRSA